MNERNRGKNSGDEQLFGTEKTQLKIKEAVKDIHYLLSRGFAEKATAELVGNRYRLRARQIQVIRAAAASQAQIEIRKSKELQYQALNNSTIYLDGFNVIILF